MRRRIAVLAVLGALAGIGSAEAGNKRVKMLRDLAQTATAFDAVLQSPASDPTPSWGSAVRKRTDADGLVASEVVLSSCAQELKFNDVGASGDFSKVVQTDLVAGAGVSLEVVDVGVGGSRTQVGGLEYHLSTKRILDPASVDEYRRCCVLQPDQCQNEVITEWWKGQGAYYTLTNSAAQAKAAVKSLKGAPSVNVDWSKGWGVQTRWPSEGSGCPAYPADGWKECSEFFAYRTQAIEVPTCQQYMADTPARDGHQLFAGVSDWFDSEATARNKARQDVLTQVAAYCGTDVSGSLDGATLEVGDRVFAVADAFACVDREDAGGVVKYRGRNRVFVADDVLKQCLVRKAVQ